MECRIPTMEDAGEPSDIAGPIEEVRVLTGRDLPTLYDALLAEDLVTPEELSCIKVSGLRGQRRFLTRLAESLSIPTHTLICQLLPEPISPNMCSEAIQSSTQTLQELESSPTGTTQWPQSTGTTASTPQKLRFGLKPTRK